MVIRISFGELSRYVIQHYGKSLTFAMVAEDELSVTYEQRVLVTTVKVPVNIRIESVTESALVLSYSGKFGLDTIIKGVLMFIKQRMPELGDAVRPTDASRVEIDLARLKQTEALVAAVAMRQIRVEEDGILVSVALK